MFDNLSPVERQVTDSSGAIKFKESGTKVMCNPSSKNAAYGRAYVIAGWTGVKIRYPDEYREISVRPIDGVVEIPLPNRRPGSSGRSRQGIGDDMLGDSFPAIDDHEIATLRTQAELR